MEDLNEILEQDFHSVDQTDGEAAIRSCSNTEVSNICCWHIKHNKKFWLMD